MRHVVDQLVRGLAVGGLTSLRLPEGSGFSMNQGPVARGPMLPQMLRTLLEGTSVQPPPTLPPQVAPPYMPVQPALNDYLSRYQQQANAVHTPPPIPPYAPPGTGAPPPVNTGPVMNGPNEGGGSGEGGGTPGSTTSNNELDPGNWGVSVTPGQVGRGIGMFGAVATGMPGWGWVADQLGLSRGISDYFAEHNNPNYSHEGRGSTDPGQEGRSAGEGIGAGGPAPGTGGGPDNGGYGDGGGQSDGGNGNNEGGGKGAGEGAAGGLVAVGQYLRGPGDGMSDDIQAQVGGPGGRGIRVAANEYVVPADVVSHFGNGSSDAGAKVLDEMGARVRAARTGKSEQAPRINPSKFVPA